jgi:hypothetical protein
MMQILTLDNCPHVVSTVDIRNSDMDGAGEAERFSFARKTSHI